MEFRDGQAIPKIFADDLTEIINLEAIMQLPKATEHFISDLHGEFEAFDHIIRNCSGVIKVKVAQLFKFELTERDQEELCFNIYYPEEFLENAIKTNQEWYILLDRLVRLTRFVSSKYTRSKVRKAMPKEYAYILEELLYQYDADDNKEEYYNSIFETIVELRLANSFAISLCYLIQRFVVDHLHVLGDIYDRGPNPDRIVDRLMEVPSIDITLGNHDIIWIGAYVGSYECMAIALRISLRYGHTRFIEEGYGIDLSRLRKFASQFYDDNPAFRPRGLGEDHGLSDQEILEITQMHQAVAIMQFKLEGRIAQRRPEFGLDDRRLLDRISYDHKTVTLANGEIHEIINGCFQLVDRYDPYEFSLNEELILHDLMTQFQNSKRLKKHIDFLVREGAIYIKNNGNLLLHGCIPCNEDGSYMEAQFGDKHYSGQELMDFTHKCIRDAHARPHVHDDMATDVLWYLWCGPASSLFGKDSMKTFETYFIADKATHKEIRNPYYRLRNDEDFAYKVLHDFELNPNGYIINGHTPVKAAEGESPIKANGKMLVIDGGLSKAYQRVTGIAGYTLVDNSHEIYLVAHEPFTSKQDAIENFRDILPTQMIVTQRRKRARIIDTDVGHDLIRQANALRNKWNLEIIYE